MYFDNCRLSLLPPEKQPSRPGTFEGMRPLLGLGALNLAVAVAIGAFGSHGLKGSLSESAVETFRIGSTYHLVHGLGVLLVLCIPTEFLSPSWAKKIAILLLFGILFFSGALYALAVSGQRSLGAVAPIGGSMFILGWLALAITLWKGPK